MLRCVNIFIEDWNSWQTFSALFLKYFTLNFPLAEKKINGLIRYYEITEFHGIFIQPVQVLKFDKSK